MTESVLGELSTRRFLREYWQRKPLFVRGAVPGLGALLDGDELAGLALEPEIESRLVIERGRTPWELRRGPFRASDFRALPAQRWTLLVQAVDQWLPQVRAVRERFAFVPGWRFDDIMISHAADKGGVGPHFDWYDVFLLQASGRRRWKLGQRCTERSALRKGTDLRILRDFHVEAEYLAEPGDLLYIPPGIAHWGVAEGECMTWSVGFRAPAHADILQEVAAEAAERSAEQRRFGDAGVVYPRDGRIPPPAIAQLQEVLRGLAGDRAAIADWFGRYMTARKYPDLDIRPARRARGELREFLAGGGRLERHPASRFAWTGGARPVLFVDGESMACPAPLARILCGTAPLDAARLRPLLRGAPARTVLDALLASGAIYRA